MKPKSSSAKKPAEQVVKDIRRKTRRHFSAEDKIRIVLDGLRGDVDGGRGRAQTRRLGGRVDERDRPPFELATHDLLIELVVLGEQLSRQAGHVPATVCNAACLNPSPKP
mgnify:CR=1 FL=1